MDELAHLQKWCYIQRKINSKILKIDSNDQMNPIFAIEDMLVDLKDLILPQFWKQKNSPKVEVKNLYSAVKTIKINISPKIKQILIHTVQSLIRDQSKSILLNLNDEQISFWIDSMNISLVLENFMDTNCLISSVFIDRIKAESGPVTSFVSDPEFINVKSQIPLSLDGASQAQPIVIGNIKRFMMIIDPCFIQTLSEFKQQESSLGSCPEKHPRENPLAHSNSQSESSSRQILKHAMNGLINLSIEKSTLSIKRDENELICDLPHGRLCTVGMSNLGMDLDMPTFISNPIGIGLINCPVSTQIIFSEMKIISILNHQKEQIFMVPSSSVSVSLNIPDSSLVPIMIIISVDLASFELNFSKDQIEFILSLSETFEKSIRTSRNSIPELSESFCAKDFDQFEFSDVTSEVKNESTNPQTEQRSIRSLTLTMTLTQGQIKFISNNDILAIRTEDLKISLADKQTHRQFKLSTTSFLIDINKETVLTTDGRGPTSFIGVETSRCEPKYEKGFNLVFTRAETKHWRKQENLSVGDRDLKLSKYVTEINFTSGPVDIVLYLRRLIPFVHFADPFISRRSVTPKKMTTTKIPLFNIELGETCIFFPDEETIFEPLEQPDTEKLNGNTFCLSIDGLVLTPRPNNPLERHVIIDSVYQSAMDSGLLDSPGSPLEDIQFELDVKGLALFTCNWSDIIHGRWTASDSGILTGENPALEWNRKDKIDPRQSGSRPILVPTNIRAAWAPAIVYKSKAITANSLEVSLNSDLMVYVALAQVGFQIFDF